MKYIKLYESKNYIQVKNNNLFGIDGNVNFNQKEIDFILKIPGFNYSVSKCKETIYPTYIDENQYPVHLYISKSDDDYYMVYGGKKNDYKCDQLSGLKQLLLNIKEINSSIQINELNLSTYRNASIKSDPTNKENEKPNKLRFIRLSSWYFIQLSKRIRTLIDKSNFIKDINIIDSFKSKNVDTKEEEKIRLLLNNPLFTIEKFNHNYLSIIHVLKRESLRKLIINIYWYKDDYYAVEIEFITYKIHKKLFYDQFSNVFNILRKIKNIIE